MASVRETGVKLVPLNAWSYNLVHGKILKKMCTLVKITNSTTRCNMLFFRNKH
jgi:hypothetical protein